MHRYFLLAVSLAALAACNKGPDINLKNASVGEVAEKVHESGAITNFVEPGRYETKVTVLEMEMPGMPAAYAKGMKLGMERGKEHSSFSCLTEADVKRPSEQVFAGKNDSCRYEHFTMSGGKIDAVMRCKGEPAGAMTMAMNGTYSTNSWEATMAMDVTGGPGGGGMKMKSRMESHRVGECTGDELKAKEQGR